MKILKIVFYIVSLFLMCNLAYSQESSQYDQQNNVFENEENRNLDHQQYNTFENEENKNVDTSSEVVDDNLFDIQNIFNNNPTESEEGDDIGNPGEVPINNHIIYLLLIGIGLIMYCKKNIELVMFKNK